MYIHIIFTFNCFKSYKIQILVQHIQLLRQLGRGSRRDLFVFPISKPQGLFAISQAKTIYYYFFFTKSYSIFWLQMWSPLSYGILKRNAFSEGMVNWFGFNLFLFLLLFKIDENFKIFQFLNTDHDITIFLLFSLAKRRAVRWHTVTCYPAHGFDHRWPN